VYGEVPPLGVAVAEPLVQNPQETDVVAIVAVGLALTVKARLAVAVQPLALVTVTV
jgi:hypothetical protein